jgi:predicted RNase H-like HicB family nuclease
MIETASNRGAYGYNRITSSATGRIKELFFHYKGALHELDIIRKMLQTVDTKTKIIILVGNQRLDKKARQQLAAFEHGRVVFDVRYDERMLMASKWVRDPFVIVESKGVKHIHFMEPERQKTGDQDVAEVIERGLENTAIRTHQHFCIDGGNLLADDDFMLVGANQFSEFIGRVKHINPKISKNERIRIAKEQLKTLFELPQSTRVIIIGQINWDTGKISLAGRAMKASLINRMSRAFSGKSLWFYKEEPEIDQQIAQEAMGIIENKLRAPKKKSAQKSYLEDQLKKIWLTIRDLGEIDINLPEYREIKEAIREKLADISNKEFRELVLRVNNIKGKIPHIDLFISLTGKRTAEGKYLAFLAEACRLHSEADTPAEVNDELNSMNEFLDYVETQLQEEAFEVRRIPMPIIHKQGASEWKLGFYCNNLVECYGGNVSIWYPKFSTSRLFKGPTPDNVMRALSEIEEQILHIFQEYSIKGYGVQCRNYGAYIRASGALHCVTKETRAS